MPISLLDSFYSLSEAEGILTITLNKRISVEEFRLILDRMKQQAQERNINKLLLDGTLVDFSDLKLSERHDIGLAAAQILNGSLKAVMVIQSEYINKHGENVATNRGADVLVTDSLQTAYEWLHE